MDTSESPVLEDGRISSRPNRVSVVMPRVLPPVNSVRVNLPGRAWYLPPIYKVSKHKKAPKGHKGNIYIAYMNYDEEVMERTFKKAANTKTPANKSEMESQGFLALNPSNDDILFMRDLYGSGKEEDDHLATYSLCKDDLSEEMVDNLNSLRSKMLGAEKDKTPDKPSFENGTYTGGIAFERHDWAKNIRKSKRSYQLASTIQIPKLMSAPGSQAKAPNTGVLDDDAKMRKDLLKYGAMVSMQGLHKHAPKDMLRHLEEQADITNLPRIGFKGNFAYPAWQLNIASAVDHANDSNLAESLGKFGSAHIDKGDSVGAPTSMLVLSKPHPDIPEEYFYLLDLGICWRLEEYAALFFSGLHFHGGSQPRFMSSRTSSDLSERLTLIGYLPDMMIEGNNNVAFAALPKQEVLKIGIEMRNPVSHQLSSRFSTEQALFVPDGPTILDPVSHLNYFSRSIVEFVSTIASQYPPNGLLRFDREKLISCFTAAIEGVRTAPDPWPNGPGWSGADTQVGTDYAPILAQLGAKSTDDLDETTLATLYNSDSLSSAPYGNTEFERINNEWALHTKKYASVVPICALADNSLVPAIGGRNQRVATRGGLVRQARNKAADESLKRKRPSTPSSSNKKRKTKATTTEKVAPKPSDDPSSSEASSSEEESETPSTTILPNNDPPLSTESGSTLHKTILGITADRLEVHLATARAASASSSMALSPFGSSFTAPSPSNSPLAATPPSDSPLTARSPSNSTSTALPLSRVPGTSHLPSDTCFDIPTGIISADARRLWSIYNYQQKQLDISTLGTWAQRQRLLLFNLSLWEWLEESLDLQYAKKSDCDAANGITRLLNDIESFWFVNRGDRPFDAASYLEGFSSGESVFTLKSRRTTRTTLVDQSFIVSTAIDILSSWLGYPSRETFQLQSWFIRGIVDAIGIDGLLIPDIWKAASVVRPAFLKESLHRMDSAKASIRSWARNGLLHSALVTDITCRDLISNIAGIVSQIHPPDDFIQLVTKRFTALPVPLPHPEPLAIPSPHNHDLLNQPAFNSFYRSIELLYIFLDNPDHTVSVPTMPRKSAPPPVWNIYHTQRYLSKVETYSDQRLPFRDHARSRRRILEPGGPFSPKNLSTRSGLFSAIIYRGVTHNTQFLQDHQTMFKDYDDWQSLYSTVCRGKSEGYFCNKSAYGQCIPQRSVDNIPQYWTDTGNTKFESWISSPVPMPFIQLYRLFMSLYAFGELTAFQLTVDYATAGKAAMPSISDMGSIICDISRGAHKGLTILGFSDTSKPGTTAAFEMVFNALYQTIPADRRAQMGFNVFTVEHALCKLDRLRKSGFPKIVQ